MKPEQPLKQFRRGSVTAWSVHVLIPKSEQAASWTVSEDEYAESAMTELTTALSSMTCIPHYHPTTLSNYSAIIDSIKASPTDPPPSGVFERPKRIVLNLCDGTEAAGDGRPGVSVLHALERSELAFTGADARFNHVSCSKVVMKELLKKRGVRAPEGVSFNGKEPGEGSESERQLLLKGKYPAILKPDGCYGAIGVSYAENAQQAGQALDKSRNQFGGDVIVLMEEYVAGREFTALVVDDGPIPGDLQHANEEIQPKVYPVLEREFDDGLLESEKFLSQDVYWNKRFRSRLAPEVDQPSLQQAARDGYIGVGGNGYARVDMRMHGSGDIYVLEVNALCGLSGGEDSSVGLILKESGETYENLLERFFRFAVARTQRMQEHPAMRKGSSSGAVDGSINRRIGTGQNIAVSW
ncbi:hypothetical protein HDV00_001356 [Rhizophlyctis rosea]|nr:hypothetical protein HDV00_001356 [Rhizophlyctis rosea]